MEERMAAKLEVVQANAIANVEKVMDRLAIISDAMDQNTALINLSAAAQSSLSSSLKTVKVMKDLFSYSRM